MSHQIAKQHTAERREAEAAARQAAEQQREVATKRRRRTILGMAGGVAVVGVVAAGLISSRPTDTATVRQAPDFTLTSTSGQQVHLADYRGKNVILYFSEGAGCQSCLVQMAQIEKDKAAFDAAGFTVLPIVMNTQEQITADMAANGVTTPFLLDDGSVSTAYGTIGKGMHGNLPGHSFVLIDATGQQRWYGEYPSMWLAPGELVAQARSHLAG
ncbi:MAG: peroxiredoxin family protein [Candidatus Nanopelagicales bacterium]